MRNDMPQSIPILLTSAEDAADAAAQFGVMVGLAQNKEDKIRDDTLALVDARTNYEQGRIVLDDFYQELKTLAGKANTFVTLARDVLKPHLGRHYSQAWNATGFVGSLVVPTKAEELQPLLQSLKIYFGFNPGYQNEVLKITPTEADLQFEKISEVRSKINAQETEVDNLRDARDRALTNLRKRLRGLIDELSQLVGPLDPIWLAFGFNMPGADETPEAPENVSLRLINNTSGALAWEAAPRAEYYRVWKKIVGVDPELVAVGSPTDLDFTLEELPANSTIEVAVSAVNNGGESPMSEVVIVKTN